MIYTISESNIIIQNHKVDHIYTNDILITSFIDSSVCNVDLVNLLVATVSSAWHPSPASHVFCPKVPRCWMPRGRSLRHQRMTSWKKQPARRCMKPFEN